MAQRLNDELGGRIVYCDGWAHDYAWLASLFEADGLRPAFKLEHVRMLLVEDLTSSFDEALARRLGEVTNLRFRSVLTARPRAVLEADREAKHVHWFSTHFSGYDRRKHDAGMAHYLPVNLGEVPDYHALPVGNAGNISASKNNRPVTMAVKPVRPPAATPLVLST